MRTSIELVPRSARELRGAVALLRARYPAIDTVNVPDVASCELGSVAAVAQLYGAIAHRIPHLRSRDCSDATLDTLLLALQRAAIDEAIIVAGDARGADGGGFTPIELIERLRRRLPELKCYAALDSHRYRDNAALAANLAAKRAAGAAGFFTQPLFSLADLDRLAPLTDGATVFWGVSPVLSSASQRYWERVNHVEFPPEFEASLTWNQHFALRLLSEVAQRGGNAYLMPIKVELSAYLEPLQARLG